MSTPSMLHNQFSWLPVPVPTACAFIGVHASGMITIPIINPRFRPALPLSFRHPFPDCSGERRWREKGGCLRMKGGFVMMMFITIIAGD